MTIQIILLFLSLDFLTTTLTVVFELEDTVVIFESKLSVLEI